MRLYRECFPDGSFPESAWLAGLEQGAVYIGEAGGEGRVRWSTSTRPTVGSTTSA